MYAAADLDRLGERLQQQFGGGVGVRLRMLSLLASLDRDNVEISPEILADYLSPFFLTSHDQTEAFRREVLHWGYTVTPVYRRGKPSPQAAQAPPPTEVEQPPPQRPRQWVRLQRMSVHMALEHLWTTARRKQRLLGNIALSLAVLSTLPALRPLFVEAWRSLSPERPSVQTTEPPPAKPSNTAAVSPPSLPATAAESSFSAAIIAILNAGEDYAGAPTLRELQASGALADGLAELSDQTALPVDQPLPLDDPNILATLASALDPNSPAADPWQAARFVLSARASIIDDDPLRRKLAGVKAEAPLSTAPLVRIADLDGRPDALDAEGRHVRAGVTYRQKRALETVSSCPTVNGLSTFYGEPGRGGSLLLNGRTGREVFISEANDLSSCTRDGQAFAMSTALEAIIRNAQGDIDGYVTSPSRDAITVLISSKRGSARVLTISRSGNLALWQDNQRLAELSAKEASTRPSVLVAASTAYIALADEVGRITLRSTTDLSFVRSLAAPLARPTALIFSPDGSRLAAADGGTFALVWDTRDWQVTRLAAASRGQAVNDVAFTADGAALHLALGDGSAQTLTSNEPLLAAAAISTKAPWSLDRFQTWARQAYGAEAAADPARLARLASARAFLLGRPLHFSSPPWDLSAPSPATADPRRRWFSALAGLALLVGLAMWIITAVRHRIYFDRSRPRSNTRVQTLFCDLRDRAEKADVALKRAAGHMLRRQREAVARLDMGDTVAATARQLGLFTPLYRALTRSPEYLVLIDSASREDHQAHRAQDYLRRLKAEGVAAISYLFEGDPGHVRAAIGQPLEPLSRLATRLGGRRLIVIGDAARLRENGGTRKKPAWMNALEAWPQRALLTTVPSGEWGRDELYIAQNAGLDVAVLSAAGLAGLNFDAIGVEPRLRRPPPSEAAAALPEILKWDTETWTSRQSPSQQNVALLLESLFDYLGYHGFRWLAACAAYPVVTWDLSAALGWELRRGDDQPIYNEALAARLSELPWMRLGEMPDWLAGALVARISAADQIVIIGFFGKVQTAIAAERSDDGHPLSLSFEDLSGTGRTPEANERFARLVTRWPKASDRPTIEAAQRLRAMLRKSPFERFRRPRALMWLAGGIALGAVAGAVALTSYGGWNDTLGNLLLSLAVLAPILAPATWLIIRTAVNNLRWLQTSGRSLLPVSETLAFLRTAVLSRLGLLRWARRTGRDPLPLMHARLPWSLTWLGTAIALVALNTSIWPKSLADHSLGAWLGRVRADHPDWRFLDDLALLSLTASAASVLGGLLLLYRLGWMIARRTGGWAAPAEPAKRPPFSLIALISLGGGALLTALFSGLAVSTARLGSMVVALAACLMFLWNWLTLRRYAIRLEREQNGRWPYVQIYVHGKGSARRQTVAQLRKQDLNARWLGPVWPYQAIVGLGLPGAKAVKAALASIPSVQLQASAFLLKLTEPDRCLAGADLLDEDAADKVQALIGRLRPLHPALQPRKLYCAWRTPSPPSAQTAAATPATWATLRGINCGSGPGVSSSAPGLAMRADGRILILRSFLGEVFEFNRRALRTINFLPANLGRYQALAPNGEMACIATARGVGLIDGAGALLREVDLPSDGSQRAAFFAGGAVLATLSARGMLAIHRTDGSPDPRVLLERGGDILTVGADRVACFLDRERSIVVFATDKTLHIERLAFAAPGPPSHMALSSNGDRLAAVFGRRVLIWELPSKALVPALELPRHISNTGPGVVFSDDGSRLAVICESAIHIFDAATGTELCVLPVPRSDIVACAFSEDGARLVAMDADERIAVWVSRVEMAQ